MNKLYYSIGFRYVNIFLQKMFVSVIWQIIVNLW